MGTELVGSCVQEDNMEIPSIPPGFESLVPFTLKRVEDNKIISKSVSTVASELETESSDDSKALKSLRRKPWINYSNFDNCSGDESDTEQKAPLRPRLPRGVIRGCEECHDCQKVVAKWRPEEARRPDIEDAPVFFPSEEEFEDTLRYIASIRPEAEYYGICRIVPPASWKPPCPLKEKGVWEGSRFATRIQRVDKLQNRDSMKKMFQVNHHKRKKKRRCIKTGNDHENGSVEVKIQGEGGSFEVERFGFEPGPDFTLDSFQKYADDFKAQYFRRSDNNLDSRGNVTVPEDQWQPSLENIEGEYWRVVEKPTEEIEVLYGADLETGIFGSGFPKSAHQAGSASDMKYINSGWNLNNFPRLPGSVLSFESSDISGVLVPWLYIGMCFSSFCWHVEDHHLYSLNYMHWGAPKMWYGVPGSDASKLEAAMRKHLPDLFEEQPDLLHKLVTQLSPAILKSEGVPVYRCVQNAGEFVLTFPRAYHAGFNCGFNCAEAVNVAPIDWLPHGQNAIELYREQGRKTSISHDKLLLGAAREAVKATWEYNLLRKYTPDNLRWKDVCGKDGILSRAFKARVEMEHVRREFLCKSSQALKMESSFDANSERECSVCLFDLHMSAAGCHHCSPDKYACLNHAKQLCSCSWNAKFFLFRYDINELKILVEALEGKLSAVYRWARLDLGLALSSYVSTNSAQAPGVTGRSSHNPEGTTKDMSSRATLLSMKQQKVRANAEISAPANVNMEMPSGVVLALEKVKSPSTNSSREKEAKSRRSYPKCKTQLSEENTSCSDASVSASERPKNKQTSVSESDVILLSDDEGDAGKKENFVAKGNCTDDIASKFTGSSTCVIDERPKQEYSQVCIKVENHVEGEKSLGPILERSSGHGLSVSHADLSINVDSSATKEEIAECNHVDYSTKLQQLNDNKQKNELSQKSLELDIDSKTKENLQTLSCNSSGSQNNLDRYYRQKGPRIAKVIRRINCNVEALNFGVVRPGKLWCDSRAIYPEGFRSRVRYIDVLDPTSMCYYVSEIIDARRDRPLFMVSLEHSPSEVFCHISAVRCWEMVRERVNQEITKQHKFGKMKLPPLQPPGSLDGMEMFGFSSPEIMQAIQAMDQNRVCTEYWTSRPLMQIPQHSQSQDDRAKSMVKSESSNDGFDKVLVRLLKKANPEELHALYDTLNDSNNLGLVNRLLKEEMHKP